MLDRLLCVLGAVAFAQLPEFIQQYRQRLGGHLDEARRQLAEFTAVASHSKLTLPEFIARTAATPDPAVARLGAVVRDTLTRVNELTAAETALNQATLWGKPFVFCAHLDPAIARATLKIYLPAVPTTLEGLIYAVAGMLTLLGLYHGLIRYPLSAAFARRRQAKEKTATGNRPTAQRTDAGRSHLTSA